MRSRPRGCTCPHLPATSLGCFRPALPYAGRGQSSRRITHAQSQKIPTVRNVIGLMVAPALGEATNWTRPPSARIKSRHEHRLRSWLSSLRQETQRGVLCDCAKHGIARPQEADAVEQVVCIDFEQKSATALRKPSGARSSSGSRTLRSPSSARRPSWCQTAWTRTETERMGAGEAGPR
jgi:hypothetical protein